MEIQRRARSKQACRRKRSFEDKKAVRTFMNHFMKEQRGRHGSPEKLAAYPCQYCKGWHITSQTQEEMV